MLSHTPEAKPMLTKPQGEKNDNEIVNELEQSGDRVSVVKRQIVKVAREEILTGENRCNLIVPYATTCDSCPAEV